MSINTSTELYCIFGNPVAHSLSPVMHNAAFRQMGLNAVYMAFRVHDIASAVMAMKTLGIRGASVTIPFKIDVLSYCDTIDTLAARIGSANTLVLRDGRVRAVNTDGEGALQALLEAGLEVQGSSILILGYGGSARAIAHTLDNHGATVTVSGRNREKGEKLASELSPSAKGKPAFLETRELNRDVLMGMDILINTTPLGMEPDTGSTPLDRELLHPGLTVFDIVYRPGKTRLLREAEERQCRTVPGISMLVYQGVRQFEMWTGTSPDPDIFFRALNNELYGT
jgi:shikimate dehydrogenase